MTKIKQSLISIFLLLSFLILCGGSCLLHSKAEVQEPYDSVVKTFDYSTMYGDDSYDNAVIFYGDSRKHHSRHMKIVENILSFEPRAVFHLGDMVSDGESTDQWDAFDTITENLRLTTDFFPVPGNHLKGVDVEWYSNHWEFGIGQGYYSLNLMDENKIEPVPIDSNGVSNYDGIVLNDVKAHIVVLHSNPGYLDEDSSQYSWLKNDLIQYQDKPVILVFHIGLYNTGVHHDQRGESHPSKILYDVLSQNHNIIACINGHDHAYQRLNVNNQVHICTGCAGESPYPQEFNDENLLIYKAVIHHTVMSLKDDTLYFTVFDSNLTIIDEFTILL